MSRPGSCVAMAMGGRMGQVALNGARLLLRSASSNSLTYFTVCGDEANEKTSQRGKRVGPAVTFSIHGHNPT